MKANLHPLGRGREILKKPRFGNDIVPDRLSESKPLVILESPFAGKTPQEVKKNIEYGRQALRDSLLRGEAPIASHLLYTQKGILDDDIPAERKLGIDAGLAWRRVSDKTVVYTDRGLSKGVLYGIHAAKSAGRPVEYRSLAGRNINLTA